MQDDFTKIACVDLLICIVAVIVRSDRHDAMSMMIVLEEPEMRAIDGMYV